jgi:hypothetical protein
MQQTDASRSRRVRRRFAIGGAGLVAALAAMVALAIPAAADTIQFTGQGTNADRSCGQFEGQPPAPGGTQTWQFNLTQTQAGATMSASFSDGTTVTNKAEDDHNGNTSMWFIVTGAGATVTSASATFTPSGPNSQFVVSHCTAGGTPPTTAPPTTAPSTTAPSTTAPSTSAPSTPGAAVSAPSAAVPVTGVPRTTG